jgi:hypothetical protein
VALTKDQAITLVTSMSNKLRARAGEIEVTRNAYESDLPLAFASPDFRRFFAARFEGFSDNWVPVVADSPTERLKPIGFRMPGAKASELDDDLWRVWQINGSDADCGLAFLDAIIGRRAFAMVWGNDAEPDTPEITFESPSEAIVAYEPGSRRKRKAGLKLWRDIDAQLEFATLYLPDQIWRFQRPTARYPDTQLYLPPAVLADFGQWQLRDDPDEPMNPKPNPLGVVPLVELPNRPLLAREPISDVHGVLAMQHAINLLWSELFTAADFASWPQRVVMGQAQPKVPILNDQGQKIGERPIDIDKLSIDKLLWLENPQAKVAEWQAASLSIFTDVIEVAVGHIAAQTRTPQHYLIGKMANLSGDALKAAETGLVKKCEEKQLYFGQALRETFSLVALAQGNKAKAKAVLGGTLRWKDAESRSESQMADALLKLKQIGFPVQFLVERYGLESPEVERVMQMIADEKQSDAEAMLNAATAGLGAKAAPADPLATDVQAPVAGELVTAGAGG